MDDGEIIVAIFRLIGLVITSIFKLIWWVLRSLWKLVQLKQLPSQLSRGQVDRAAAGAAAAARPVAARPMPPRPAGAKALETARRDKLNSALAAVERRATAMAETARLERPSRRFLPALTEYVPETLQRVRQEVRDTQGELRPGHERAALRLGVVLDEIEILMDQRRDPVLRVELGDADRLADACYRPIIDFARSKDLPLTTGWPATQLAPFDLSIWTGFVPTSIAPIFLPPQFFARTVWWPALCHEIGHDFFASVSGLEPRLRDDLALPSFEVGARPLTLGPEGFDVREVPRLFGGWFEELFCDVFGTLMCGPAYVATMMELFGAESDVREVLIVPFDETGRRYDMHPPRHLRVLAGCAVLERAGLHGDAKRLRTEWERRHTALRGPDRILFPVQDVLLPLPIEHFIAPLTRIVERLYAGPLDALAGFGLQDVSGLDYGPHEHADSERAREALLRGSVPRVIDPRAVVAGAVFAALARPELEPQILANARAAIPALGTFERLPDAYGPSTDGDRGLRLDRAMLVDAIALREVLGVPRSRRSRA